MAPLRLLLAALVVAACLAPAAAAELERRDVAGGDFDDVRDALLEAIEAEGLIAGPVSHFGEMLERTDASLHHGAAVYERAEIFSFCSVVVAAALVREDPARIADCPLTVALYRLKGASALHLAYRRRDGTTPAATAANRLLERIVGRALGSLPAGSR